MAKQKRKVVLCILLALCMMMTTASVNVNAATKANWYKTVLNKKNQTYFIKRFYKGSPSFEVNRKQFKYYKAVDINKDGVKELFLSTTSMNFIAYGQKVVLFTYYKGKVIPVVMAETAGGSAFYYKKGYLIYYHRLAGQDNYDIYKLNKGKLKQIVALECDNYTIRNGRQVMTYRRNSKKCSKATYQKYYKKYVSGKKKITYQKIK